MKNLVRMALFFRPGLSKTIQAKKPYVVAVVIRAIYTRIVGLCGLPFARIAIMTDSGRRPATVEEVMVLTNTNWESLTAEGYPRFDAPAIACTTPTGWFTPPSVAPVAAAQQVTPPRLFVALARFGVKELPGGVFSRRQAALSETYFLTIGVRFVLSIRHFRARN